MVNYLYDLDEIERNHEAFVNRGQIAASAAVKKLLPTAPSRLRAALPALWPRAGDAARFRARLREIESCGKLQALPRSR